MYTLLRWAQVASSETKFAKNLEHSKQPSEPLEVAS